LAEIQTLIDEYNNLVNKIKDLDKAISLNKKTNEILLIVKKTEDQMVQTKKYNLPDPRLMQFKKDRFEEQLSNVKKELFSYLYDFIKYIYSLNDDLKNKLENNTLLLDENARLDIKYWQFISECFHMDYPLAVFDCIFFSDKIEITNNQDIVKSLRHALEFLRFVSEVESGDSGSISILRMNWELLLRTTVTKNLYARIIRKIGISSKPIIIDEFCKSEKLEIKELEKTINELCQFSPHTGLKFPVLNKIENGIYDFNCYGAYLWHKFGFVI